MAINRDESILDAKENIFDFETVIYWKRGEKKNEEKTPFIWG